MIQSVSVQNYLSFKEEATLSFEATKDQSLKDYQVVEVSPGVNLLKLGIVYGANASGKSNLLNALEFLKTIWFTVPESKNIETGVIPFLLDNYSSEQPSKFNIVFFSGSLKYAYSLEIINENIQFEKLDFYPGRQPATIFERRHNNGISEILFGPKIKINKIAKDEINIKCLPNMSFFSAYSQVNIHIPEIDTAINWMKLHVMNSINPKTQLIKYAEGLIAGSLSTKNKILSCLQQADMNIADISTETIKEEAPESYISDTLKINVLMEDKALYGNQRYKTISKTIFKHKVTGGDNIESYFNLPIEWQSEGTKRIFGLSGAILNAIENNAFLAIDEIESKLHPRMIEFVIERFLQDSDHAQLLLTTHYDGLLEEEDLLRKDNIWFTEKRPDASTQLYPLIDFKAVNRITSLQKAYKYGKFGAIP
jgi:AAA15 family ATPase/GTPase